MIIGAKRIDQLQQNLAAADLSLTEDEMKQLDEVSALPPEYPGWRCPSRTSIDWPTSLAFNCLILRIAVPVHTPSLRYTQMGTSDSSG